MSVSPAQNLANPSPVPGPSTDVATPGLAPSKASPTRAVIGSTVEDPDTTMLPDRSPPVPPSVVTGSSPDVVVVSPSPPHAATTSARTKIRPQNLLMRDFIPVCSFLLSRSEARVTHARG